MISLRTFGDVYIWQYMRQILGGKYIYVTNGSGSGLGNINLEQYTRQDQMTRVARATTVEPMTGDRATTPESLLRCRLIQSR